MNYTTNYHLPQWVESDRILMEDFNDAMETLDGGIAAAKAAADTAKTTADAAQDAADAAQSSADAAQAAADNAFCPENMPYVFGNYIGTGSQQSITLGFKPTALIIMRNYGSNTPEDAEGAWAFVTPSRTCVTIQFLEDGFRLLSLNSGKYPAVNWGNYNYNYIAFR